MYSATSFGYSRLVFRRRHPKIRTKTHGVRTNFRSRPDGVLRRHSAYPPYWHHVIYALLRNPKFRTFVRISVRSSELSYVRPNFRTFSRTRDFRPKDSGVNYASELRSCRHSTRGLSVFTGYLCARSGYQQQCPTNPSSKRSKVGLARPNAW